MAVNIGSLYSVLFINKELLKLYVKKSFVMHINEYLNKL